MSDKPVRTRRPAVRKRRSPIPGGLAEMIAMRRSMLEMSLQTVAEAACVDRTLIWQLEVGRSVNPKVLVLNGLSIALKVPFSTVCQASLVDALSREKDA